MEIPLKSSNVMVLWRSSLEVDTLLYLSRLKYREALGGGCDECGQDFWPVRNVHKTCPSRSSTHPSIRPSTSCRSQMFDWCTLHRTGVFRVTPRAPNECFRQVLTADMTEKSSAVCANATGGENSLAINNTLFNRLFTRIALRHGESYTN